MAITRIMLKKVLRFISIVKYFKQGVEKPNRLKKKTMNAPENLNKRVKGIYSLRQVYLFFLATES